MSYRLYRIKLGTCIGTAGTTDQMPANAGYFSEAEFSDMKNNDTE
jgi:hypothetical protein